MSSKITNVFAFVVIFVTLCNATLDLSNLDLANFKFFKNTEGDRHHHGSSHLAQEALFELLEPVHDQLQKAKAVLVYFRNVFFGNPDLNVEETINFQPNFGEAWQPHYEHKYGSHGENLVDALGRGYSPKEFNQNRNQPNNFQGYRK